MNHSANYSLRSWVIILTLTPTILVSLMLGGFFTFSLFDELENSLDKQGINIISPLAISAEHNLKNNQRAELKSLIERMHRFHSPLVNSISVYNESKALYVASNYNEQLANFKQAPDNKLINVQYFDDFILVSSAITVEDADPASFTQTTKTLGYLVIQLNNHTTLLEQHRIGVTTFIIILLGIQLNLFFTFRLISHVTNPIGEMVRAITKIREGKLDTRLHGQLIGEMDILKRGINSMGTSLKEYQDKMQHNIDHATSELRETMEQIEIKNVELDIANKKAQEGNRIKSEFLANMSHELRTPLNGVIGLTQQLLKTQLLPNQVDYLQTIEKSAQGLFNIIKDILDFSKLEAGKLYLDNSPFSLRENIDNISEILATSAHEKNINFFIDIKPQTVDNLTGDHQRFQQILINLIGNAIKFTKEGSVRLNIHSHELSSNVHQIFFEVIDTGIGIEAEQLPRLFNAFAQADSSISRKYGGSGLGLVITKRLIEEMGGEISCVSEAGIGSKFYSHIVLEESNSKPNFYINANIKKSIQLFYSNDEHLEILTQQLNHWNCHVDSFNVLQNWQQASQHNYYDCTLISYDGPYDDLTPLKQLINATKNNSNVIVLINTNDLIIHQKVIALGVDYCLITPTSCIRLYNSIEKIQALTPQSRPKKHNSQYANKRVLVVDDNEANLKLITTILQDKVGSLVQASNGQEAVDSCKATKFDIIFMDIQMPVLDGLQATAIIRKHGINQLVPIIATTAHALEEEKQDWLNMGMDDFLTKPLKEQTIDQILKHWLETSHITRSVIHSYQLNDNETVTELDDNHISWDASLEQAMGKEDLAYDMLQMLIDSIPANISSIEKAIGAQQRDELLKIIHKLHGACCYTGVPQLKRLAASIETALKQNVDIADIEPELLEILDELQLVATIGGTYLKQRVIE
ncbi:two-component sensor histidine kinase BarA [Psychrobium sp. 1_MG-2023]|uniref:two-component sensor histidine kinase BarA n=1 Tax=Psychrobium sp. 1_MG-2023 TaxID=3062624 RepID=UPI002733D2AF|nr:two-component sensor histidine kinase BarA [Psychrobium sp. 1_MG-2023]MDP2560578.1 two-component sensor histidine kinase BarA [Psychrobium sp. 1_MG-2023]